MNVTLPLSLAWERMKAALFYPFRPERWLLLGFSAWLAGFLRGEYGNVSYPFNFTRHLSAGLSGHSARARWTGRAQRLPDFFPIDPSMPQFGWIVAGMVVGVVALVLLFLWLGCRGQFMLLDNLIHDREDVRRPWREQRAAGNSFFRFYLIIFAVALGLIMLLFLVILVVAFLCRMGGATVVSHWPGISAGHGSFGLESLFFLIFLLWVILWAVAAAWLFLLRDFGVLWMYRNGGTAWEAAQKITALAMENPTDFALYLLVRFALGLAIFFIRIMVGCLTCCVGTLPYVEAVVTLPLSVFRVWYAVECFAQLGPDCDLRPGFVPPPLFPPAMPPNEA